MKTNCLNQIPLTQDRDILYHTVRDELARLRETYPHSPLKMMNSLAAGADQLCADAAEELGIPLTAVLPMETEEYRKDFDGLPLEKLNHHLERAECVFAAPAAEREPAGADRNFRYRQAGIFMAEHCHILIALWDGKPDDSRVGTAAAVSFALEGNWYPESGMPVRSADNSMVLHILTPREGDTADGAGTVRRLGNADNWKALMDRTEEFNTLAGREIPEGTPLLPENSTREPAADQGSAVRRDRRRQKIYGSRAAPRRVNVQMHNAGRERRALQRPCGHRDGVGT